MKDHAARPSNGRLLSCLPEEARSKTQCSRLIGVLEGSGIGPSVIQCSLEVLNAAASALNTSFEIRRGGLIGEDARKECGQWLPDKTVKFCAEIFGCGGAILSGPGAGRYVYDLRRQFDLYCKFVPVRPAPELAGAGALVPDHVEGVDVLIVRDNSSGVYQGRWSEQQTREGRLAEHSFSYTESAVRRIVEAAARAASHRRGMLHIIVKDGGVPSATALWRDVGATVAREHGVQAECMNVDLAAYELIRNPRRFDVIVAPNLFGDIIADIAGLLVASRGMTFSGNFDGRGNAVYQTNHGCAHDLAGRDEANPAGQILSLAMLLRESLAMPEAAALIEDSLTEVWRQGWRTADIAQPGCRTVGTRAFASQVAENILRAAPAPQMA
jgi:3-isopropylmalate dehydrogenase